jgi:hypothetical protein
VLQSFVTIKPAAEKILSDGTDVDEQLNTGAQKPRVLYIYRNYLFTTQENQFLAFDSFRVIISFEKLHKL